MGRSRSHSGERGVCYRGDYELEWLIVARADRWIMHRNHSGRKPEQVFKVVGIENTSIVYDMTVSRNARFVDLLWIVIGFEVTEPRDRVYAVLGLFSRSSRHIVTSIVPDYLAPLKTVYADATRALVLESGSLRVLGLIDTLTPPSREPQKESAWPSWVPRYDWSIGLLADKRHAGRRCSAGRNRQKIDIRVHFSTS